MVLKVINLNPIELCLSWPFIKVTSGQRKLGPNYQQKKEEINNFTQLLTKQSTKKLASRNAKGEKQKAFFFHFKVR